MTVVVKNFSHPITDMQKQQLADLLEIDNPELIFVENYPFHVDFSGDIMEQALAVFKEAYADCYVDHTNTLRNQNSALVITRPPALTEGTMLAAVYVYDTFGVFPIIPGFQSVRGLTPRFDIYTLFDFNRPGYKYAL